MKQHTSLTLAVLCTILLAAPAVASAQAPGGASSLSATPARTVTLNWPSVTGATYYYIWVTDPSGVPRYQKWHTASELNCGASQTTTCQMSVPMFLSPGTATWWVQTWNASGFGPWSSAHTFEIPGPLFAVVSAAGVLTRGNAASATKTSPGTGRYEILFHRNVSGCVFNVNLGTTDVLQASPGFATSARRDTTPTGVFVTTFNSASPPAAADRDFHLSVVCE